MRFPTFVSKVFSILIFAAPTGSLISESLPARDESDSRKKSGELRYPHYYLLFHSEVGQDGELFLECHNPILFFDLQKKY